MQLEEPYIELNNVSFSYDHTSVLENLSFTVRKGEYLGIIGPNGGGKTTLIKIILGLLQPTSGTISLFGKDRHDFKEKYRIGYVPQRITQAEKSFPATVFEVVRTGRIARLGFFERFTKDDTDAVERAMEISGIARYRDTLIGNLSGGERQRVFIARALASEPDVLILDEPTVGVDIGAQKTFYDFLSSLNKEHNITIIFISHDIDAVSHETKTVLCLNHNLVCHGLPQDLLNEHILERLYGKHSQRVPHHK
ncbi:MAG: ABC transporter ATP-binding protein [Parcubacteria group bacterium GW2011_GWC1_42_11]|uniref:ABC transporter ATP-binding protein n=1 Tax=Candidatus Nomurabacteria bacterium GW2011_GWC2_42_20 TaxID=1618756 RepID=A0A0G0ZF46_9BACT|nr:MAG: ABC transporter ATP-binding protein [Parcubacteria group bacterium GW2011_GWC1_42_11]KKS47370.1 MAG: ABC transporter ATP-binding protein [Candidatus Nomurabacteria bacterium GW2011_GWC2_42_20]HBH71582.1 zinc ABC transporter ATP-binding protein [Candidatus Yonathbacteria bacterium]